MWKQSKSRHPQILWQVFPQAVAYLHFTHCLGSLTYKKVDTAGEQVKILTDRYHDNITLREFFIFDKSFNRGKIRYLHVSLHTIENTVNSHKK